jgi:hypothetical protein
MALERRVYKAQSRDPANRMGDFFGGLRSGIQFPQVVMNQGPLPGAGGLPQPLHETPDARINYGSSLLGNLTPYAYGEPGYLSSQNAYLNIPHKIQKIVPVVYLPEAKNPARDIVDLSHPIDDADLAFVLRLNRNSMFCTGLKNASMRRAGLGTAIDPFINLCTLNYILSGMQLGISGNDTSNLWVELLENMNRARFGRQGGAGRDYVQNPINLNDIIHVVRHCIRPFGVTRGSEKQGGQDEATLAPATWPVSFVVSLTVDGKESNVLNIWHHHELSAGDDLVLRLKPMPIRQYTLNHYYKGVKRQAWDRATLPDGVRERTHVWQLVPDLLTLEEPDEKEYKAMAEILRGMPNELKRIKSFPRRNGRLTSIGTEYVNGGVIWQELGFWHVGRTQVMTRKYGTEEYWHNDLANSLRTNHLDITLQPVFQAFPQSAGYGRDHEARELKAEAPEIPSAWKGWEPMLGLERLGGEEQGSRWLSGQEEQGPPWLSGQEEQGLERLGGEQALDRHNNEAPAAAGGEPDWLGRLEFADEDERGGAALPPLPEEGRAALEEEEMGPPAKKVAKGGRRGGAGKAVIGGSLLKADGTSEPSMVGIL